MDAFREMPKSFTARQVLAITGVKASKLTSWVRSGIIRPSMAVAEGRGSRRLYSLEDLFVIGAASTLRDSGLTGRALRKALDNISKNFQGPTGIECVGRDVCAKQGGESVSVLQQPGQMTLDFTPGVATAIAEVNENLKRKWPASSQTPARQLNSAERGQRSA
jgi:DNA-binding transcriptional MerR regulator